MKRDRPSPDPLGRVPLFSGMSSKELTRLGRLMTRIPVKAGRELTHQGDPGLEFFIIVDGKADVMIDGKVVATLGPGDFLGEMALLDGKPRTATVVCATDVEAEVISYGEFSQLLEDAPELTRRILVALAGRLRDADSKLEY